MKKYFVLLVLLSISGLAFSQVKVFVNLNAGWDHTSNMYYNYNNYEIFENGEEEFSYGFDLGLKLSDVVRFRVATTFGSYCFGQMYTNMDVTQTDMTMKYFNITPRFDFRILHKGNFETFLSPGLKLEYISDADQKSYRTDGSVSDAKYVSTAYEKSMTGVAAAMIMKYNFNSNLGLTLTPEYSYFFKKLYEKNDQNLNRFSARLGLEWTF